MGKIGKGFLTAENAEPAEIKKGKHEEILDWIVSRQVAKSQSEDERKIWTADSCYVAILRRVVLTRIPSTGSASSGRVTRIAEKVFSVLAAMTTSRRSG